MNPIVSAAVIGPVIILWRKRLTKMPKHKKDAQKISTLYQSLANIDYIGIVVFAGAVTSLLLGLQYGGSVYSWSDRRTIACLVIGIALSLGFVLVEWWKGDDAIVPPKVIRDRVVILSSVFTATLDGAYFVVTYQVRSSHNTAITTIILTYEGPDLVSSHPRPLSEQLWLPYPSTPSMLRDGYNGWHDAHRQATLLPPVHDSRCCSIDYRIRSADQATFRPRYIYLGH